MTMTRSQEIEKNGQREGDLDGLITLARETWNLRDAALQKLAMDLQNGEHRQQHLQNSEGGV